MSVMHYEVCIDVLSSHFVDAAAAQNLERSGLYDLTEAERERRAHLPYVVSAKT